MSAPSITVLTATHNRAGTLPRLYESLEQQTYTDFEWLVVDDGSTDGTAAVIEGLIGDASFPIRYLHKPNGGKHTAVNLGVQEAAGAMCAVIDDDDWYLPNGLERLKFHWDSIPDQDAFAEVQGLCMSPHGDLIGMRYPEPVFDTDYLELNEVLGIKGDRRGMIRTDVLRRFPFPEQFGGRFLDERIVWNRISATYRTRGVNEFIGYADYLDTGLSSIRQEGRTDMSDQQLLYYQELIAMKRKLPARTQYKAYASLIRNGLHQHRSLPSQLLSTPGTAWWLAALPVGALLYLRDLRRA
jgi:glycosyltransferase involved in cell wall biosynthesis